MNALLPNTFPTARSKAPIRTAVKLATNSGSVTLTPDFPKVGDNVHLDVEILNAGDQPALATTVELLDAAGTVLGTQPLPALAGHTGATVGFDWTPPAGPGDYALTVRMNVPPGAAEATGDRRDCLSLPTPAEVIKCAERGTGGGAPPRDR